MRSFAAWCLSRFGRLCGRSPATVRSVSANPGGGYGILRWLPRVLLSTAAGFKGRRLAGDALLRTGFLQSRGLLPFVVEFKLPAVFLLMLLGVAQRLVGAATVLGDVLHSLVVDLLLLTPVAFAAHRLVIEEGGASGPRDFLRLVSRPASSPWRSAR
ncbi:MAG: hypothetical protein ACLQNE_01570 [Thermoguttaceae bacterium]